MTYTPSKRFYTSFLLFLIPAIAFTQYNQSHILQGLEGGDLYDALVDNYKPYHILDYDHARDTLFKHVYGTNDSLYGVYTRHRVYMDPDEDPTSYVYKNGQADGINTEHSYPRSKGARYGNAKSDMHHLFPTRIPVNAMRSNFPYQEIRDQETEIWYVKNRQQSSIPSTDIDSYSEFKSFAFEPREAFKGNIARAIFYFYTMYRQKAEEADNLFFDSMRKTLCRWHDEDPVDSLEFVRTHLISQYQDGKVNPFVIDCTLAARLYCNDVTQTCEITAVKVANLSQYHIKIKGNPVENNTLNIEIECPDAGFWELRIINMLGAVKKREKTMNAQGRINWRVDIKDLPKGVYFLQFSFKKTPHGKSIKLPSKEVLVH